MNGTRTREATPATVTVTWMSDVVNLSCISLAAATTDTYHTLLRARRSCSMLGLCPSYFCPKLDFARISKTKGESPSEISDET